MKPRIDEKKVFEQFQVVYKGRENRLVGDRWHQDAMRRIGGLGPMKSRRTYFIGFEYLVWRMAPVFSLTLIILSALLYKLGLYPEIDPLHILMNIENESILSYLAGL